MPRNRSLTNSVMRTRRYRVLELDVGWIGFVVGPYGVQHIRLPERSRSALQRALQRGFTDAVEDDRLLPDLATALRDYFAGHDVRFDVPIDVRDASPFLREVWDACRRIPYGCTLSYSELAEEVGRPKAARAIGQAMRRNRLPILIPCHRVLRRDGGLGGFSATQGTALKHRLLHMERTATQHALR